MSERAETDDALLTLVDEAFRIAEADRAAAWERIRWDADAIAARLTETMVPGRPARSRDAVRVGAGGAVSGDTVRTYISDDYYEHEQFDTSPQTWWSESDVYDVPREQVERWQAAQDAWEAAPAGDGQAHERTPRTAACRAG